MKIYCNCGNEIKTTWWKEFLTFLSDIFSNAISGIITGFIIGFFAILLLGYIFNFLAKEYPEITFEFFRSGVCEYTPEQLITNIKNANIK